MASAPPPRHADPPLTTITLGSVVLVVAAGTRLSPRDLVHLRGLVVALRDAAPDNDTRPGPPSPRSSRPPG